MVGTSCVDRASSVVRSVCSGGTFRNNEHNIILLWKLEGGREKMRRCLNTRKSITQDCTQQLLFS
eukprot:scaffold1448_cov71-Skeletonema_dohrnii-CCMP3373.AAC.3